jgi:hypothetical protein
MPPMVLLEARRKPRKSQIIGERRAGTQGCCAVEHITSMEEKRGSIITFTFEGRGDRMFENMDRNEKIATYTAIGGATLMIGAMAYFIYKVSQLEK